MVSKIASLSRGNLSFNHISEVRTLCKKTQHKNITCTMYMTKITNDQTVRNNLSPIRLVLYQNAFTEFEKRTGNIKPTKKAVSGN